MNILAAVPVKPFGVAKARLAPVLDASTRSRLGKRIAEHTVGSVAATGATPVVLTADPGVAEWATRQGVDTVADPGTGLNQAAACAVTEARRRGMAWAVVHADLPCVTPADLAAAFHMLPRGGLVLAPAFDGGTNLICGDLDEFRFAYGSSSFHHHIRRAAAIPHRVVLRWRLALDLDTPLDLERARALTARWGEPAGRFLLEP